MAETRWRSFLELQKDTDKLKLRPNQDRSTLILALVLWLLLISPQTARSLKR